MKVPTIKQVRDDLYKRKVCFVTNGWTEPGSLLWPSMNTWRDLAKDNILIVPASYENIPYFYGRNAFLYMLDFCIHRGYDYIIYMDEDFFLNTRENGYLQLYELFNVFAWDDEHSLAGMPDGGMVCHRNHNNLLINTFVSFWNLRLIRDAFRGDFNELAKREGFETFRNNNKHLYTKLQVLSSQAIKQGEEYRKTVFKESENYESPYCGIVRNDPNNPCEPNQIPYSCKEDDFEPYYSVQENILVKTQKPIMYLLASDAYFPKSEYGFYEQSGITTVMLDKNLYNNTFHRWAFHTWFAREWNIEQRHTDRIKKVVEWCEKQENFS